ncbi:MAG: hypothetical protein ABR553_07010 [Gammaproteobacteria bacterium]
MNGFAEGVKTLLKMTGIGLGMLKTKRLSPLEVLNGHTCNGVGEIAEKIPTARPLGARNALL